MRLSNRPAANCIFSMQRKRKTTLEKVTKGKKISYRCRPVGTTSTINFPFNGNKFPFLTSKYTVSLIFIRHIVVLLSRVALLKWEDNRMDSKNYFIAELSPVFASTGTVQNQKNSPNTLSKQKDLQCPNSIIN